MFNLYKNYLILFAFALLLTACNSGKALFKKGLSSSEKAEFTDAIAYYEEALKEGYTGSDIHFQLGEAYRKSNRIREAEPHYRQAIDQGATQDELIYFHAQALKADGQYDEAYKKFKTYSRNGSDRNYIKIARDELKHLDVIDSLLQIEHYITVENCTGVNSPFAEFSPVYYDGQLIFSTSRKEGVFNTTGGGFLGLYAFKFSDEQNCEGRPRIFDGGIYLENANEASATFNPDGDIMIFARGNTGERESEAHNDEVHLYRSFKVDGVWTEPEEIQELYRDEKTKLAWDASPMFNLDGTRLYFSSTRTGKGDLDLYEARINAVGKITGVRRMSPAINTSGNEMFPFVDDQGHLYFSSDGHQGFGSLDIFKARPEPGSKRYSIVENVGVPFNSPADDFGVFYLNDSTGYFSSNRKGGRGDDDIYKFIDRTPHTKTANYFLAIEVVTYDQDSTEIPLSDTYVEFRAKEGGLLKEFTSNTEGKGEAIPVKLHSDYQILGSKEEYFVKQIRYTTKGKAVPEEDLTAPVTDIFLTAKLVMEPIICNKEIVLENVYYDRQKWDIRPDAAKELDNLVALLNDNPTLDIQLGSHTDSRGSDEYNFDLSQKRAQSAVDYLIAKGIEDRRLQAVGFGKRELLILDAKTEEEHQVNRRTEFRVICQ